MDLTKIDELDARQKALDEERAQARKAARPFSRKFNI